MPHLIWTRRALGDLVRLQEFLQPKSPRAARAATDAILAGLDRAQQFPESGRPVDDLPAEYREVVVPFSSSGYLIRYRLEGGGIVVVAVRHMREAGYQP